MRIFKCKLLATAAGAVYVMSGTVAQGDNISQWNFENYTPTTPLTVVNNPTPSTGAGTAAAIGFGLYPTPNVGVVTCDVLINASPTNTTNLVWRLRDQAGANGAANGWSSAAPQYTQGAEFDVATSGFKNIVVSFDWAPTGSGVEDVELQYNTNISNSAGWTNAQLFSNTVSGGTYNVGTPVDLSAISGANDDANFGIRIVSAYHPGTSAYANTTGTALNNTSGNVRLDNVTIAGTPVATPEPGSFILLAAGSLGLLTRRRRTL